MSELNAFIESGAKAIKSPVVWVPLLAAVLCFVAFIATKEQTLMIVGVAFLMAAILIQIIVTILTYGHPVICLRSSLLSGLITLLGICGLGIIVFAWPGAASMQKLVTFRLLSSSGVPPDLREKLLADSKFVEQITSDKRVLANLSDATLLYKILSSLELRRDLLSDVDFAKQAALDPNIIKRISRADLLMRMGDLPAWHIMTVVLAVREGEKLKPTIEAADDKAVDFYAMENKEALLGSDVGDLLQKLEKFMDHEYFQKFEEDQVRMSSELLGQGKVTAKVPIVFNETHPDPNYRNRVFYPMIVHKETKREDERAVHYFTVLYLNLGAFEEDTCSACHDWIGPGPSADRLGRQR